jgi:hypothetical protein
MTNAVQPNAKDPTSMSTKETLPTKAVKVQWTPCELARILTVAAAHDKNECNKDIYRQAATLIDSLRTRLDAAEKELEKRKLRSLANAINQICDECGHTKTEDGCAFCIKKATAELAKVLLGAQTTLQKLGSITDENRIGWTLQAIDAAIQKGQE